MRRQRAHARAILLLTAIGLAALTTAAAAKPCRRLCHDQIASCQDTCSAGSKKARRACRSACRTALLRACKASPDTATCLDAAPPTSPSQPNAPAAPGAAPEQPKGSEACSLTFTCEQLYQVNFAPWSVGATAPVPADFPGPPAGTRLCGAKAVFASPEINTSYYTYSGSGDAILSYYQQALLAAGYNVSPIAPDERHPCLKSFRTTKDTAMLVVEVHEDGKILAVYTSDL